VSDLATLFYLFLLNLTLVCAHSLHRWGKERGFQQLGPGLHLVAGGISRLVCWEVARESNVVGGLGPGRLGGVAILSAVPGVMSGVGSAALETAVVVLQVLSFAVGEAGKAWAVLLMLLIVELGCHGVDSDSERLDRGHKSASGGVDTNVIDFHCHWVEGRGRGWCRSLRAHTIHSLGEHAFGSSPGAESIDVIKPFGLGAHVEKGVVGVRYLIGLE
jgi:hypothetical protein